MAAGGGDGGLILLMKEFEAWLETTPDGHIYLLQVNMMLKSGLVLYIHIR